MGKTKAFTKFIGAKGSGQNEGSTVNQSSPAWVLTFVRWDVRDTIRAVASTGTQKELFQVRDPLVVENDCVQASVVVNKSVLTHSFNAVLVETDVNYSTAIAPGDFVFVNMLNWEKDARRIALTASEKKTPINGVNDGFKGLFKIQGVRKSIQVDPGTGVKRVFIRINGFAFTEFNNTIYYNPYLRTDNQGTDKDGLLFASNLQADYAQLITPDHNANCQDLIRALIQAFIGVGVSDKGIRSTAGMPITANTHFYMPQQVGALLGVPSAKAAKDIYNYLFGIQQYAASSSNSSMVSGLNPANISQNNNRFYYTADPCPGNTLLKAEYWNQVNAWSILNQYTNSPINELYTCFRVSPEGRVMPTVVFRQIPFTSDMFGTAPFKTEAKTTKFLNLPRWKVGSSLITQVDLGREEAARVNFVQYYASPPSDIGKPDGYISAQTALGNYTYDINDVIRSGLRPYIVNSTFQNITKDNDVKFARQWAMILGDAVVGGHLKLNGTIECIGISEPIAVGDNFEYDGAVYHIEEVTHACNVDPVSGNKVFRTSVKLSHGVSIADSTTGLAYPEMTHTVGYQDRKDNFNNGNQSLPGISEEQDVRYRVNNPTPAPSKKEVDRKDRPFAQPGKVIKPIKEDNDE